MKGIVLFDYDGTLVDERFDILEASDKTKQAMKQLKQNHYLCLLATGRAYSYIPTKVKQLNLAGIIGCNGAYIMIHNEMIYTQYMELNFIKSFITLMKKHHVAFMLEAQESCYVNDLSDEYYNKFMHYFKMEQQGFSLLDENSRLDQVFKITLFLKNKAEQLKWQSYYEQLGYQVSLHRGGYSLDFGMKKVTKGSAIKYLKDYYQLSYDQLYAFGDGDNDYEMLKSVGYGIAMGICHESLLEVCKMQTKSVKEEGIYVALKELKLIK